MSVQLEADRIMKMGIKTKAQGDAVIKKIARRNGQNFAAELRAELQRRYREKSNEQC